MNKQRVSEVISPDEIKTWKSGEVISIKAGTGAGKSYFIKNILYAFAKANNKRILFLIHRKNCVNQFEQEIIKDKKTDIIKIMTYQKIETSELKNNKFDLSKYQYIVSDEFHYFMSDASFNKTTDISLNRILENKNAVKIFMSATGDFVKGYINLVKNINIKNYELDINYKFIRKLSFFNNDKTMDNFIAECIQKGDKGIFFVESAEKAYKLYSKYVDNCLFNCSSSNIDYYKYVDKEKINEMLNNERFEENVLITTTCMDAGVNIKDTDLLHAVCDVKDTGTLIQCIGRKRIQNEDDRIYLYIKNITNQQLGGRETQLRNKIEKADFFRSHTVKEYIEKYPRSSDYTHIVYDDILDEENICTKKMNELMYFKVKSDILEIENMLQKKSKKPPKYGYCKYMSKMFGFEDNFSIIEEDYDADSLELYLENMVGKPMYQVKDRKELIEKIDVKSNGKLLRKINNLNGALEERKIPYRIIEFSTSEIKNGKQKRYPNSWRIEKLIS